MMGLWDQTRDQLAHYKSILLLLYLPLIAVFILIAVQSEVQISDLTRDAVDLLDGEIYTGIISDIGIYIWFSASVMGFLSAAVIMQIQHKKEESRFMLVLALMNFYLVLDDRLMIHDKIVSGGEVLYLPYVLVTLYVVYHFRRVIFNSPYVLLFLTLGFMGVSVGVDAVKDLLRLFEFEDLVYGTIGSFFGTSGDRIFQIAYLLEDSFKLMGIVGMLLYVMMFTYEEITAHLVDVSKRDE